MHPGTRAAILSELVEWVKAADQPLRVRLLHGCAGIGKTAIAHALCQQLSNDYLGASFFFDRGSEEHRTPSNVFPTIAYQLAHSRAAFLQPIADAVEKHRRSSQVQNMVRQAEDLIINPLKELINLTLVGPALIVMDGVHECPRHLEDAVRTMLTALCRAAKEVPFLRILIVTRPETRIMYTMRSCPESAIIELQDLEQVPPEVVNADIHLFIRSTLEHGTCDDPLTLVGERPDCATELTRRSNGLFVYASCVVRRLVREYHNAVYIYDALLRSDESITQCPALYEDLDKLYRVALEDALGGYRDDVDWLKYIRRVLAMIALVDHCFSARDLIAMGIPEGHTRVIIGSLRSLLSTGVTIQLDEPIQPRHDSFSHFLRDRRRCTDPDFLVELDDGNGIIAYCLLNYLSGGDALHMILASLAMYGEDTQCQTPTLSSLILRDNPSLRFPMYAYANWTKHLCKSVSTEAIQASLRRFTGTQLVQWRNIARRFSRTTVPYERKELLAIVEVRDWYKVLSST